MIKKSKFVLFIGAFDLNPSDDVSTSSAGNQVQFEIANELNKKVDIQESSTFQSISMKPLKTWPVGAFLWSGLHKKNVYMPPFINIVGLKRLIFSIFILIALIRTRPSIVVKYNITAVEAFVLLIYRIVNPATFLVAVIQDVHYTKNKGVGVKKIFELLAMKLVTRFDMLIPISERIKNDFFFSTEKTRVFNGGLTRQGRSLLAASDDKLEPYAVFAGALMPYNGIDLLVRRWISENIEIELHVFGKGSSDSLVHDAAVRYPTIIFHGFKSEEEVSSWQKNALVNFCLRYSEGIEAAYFFPSKLFNIICAPGAVMANRFDGFPSALENSCLMLADDLSDLSEKIDMAKNHLELNIIRARRREWIEANGSWSAVVRDIFARAAATK